MKDWPLVSLGDIFEIARGGSPRPIDKFITEDIDGINWIMISDASDSSKYITKTKKRILQSGVKNSRMVYPGDFLLTNSMSFGKPYIMQTTGCIHDGWLVFSNKKKLADPDYFYHLLGSSLIYSEFERRAAGATVKNLNIDLVRSVEIPLPPLAEQKRIAAILDQADALRKARRRAIERLNDLSQSIFYEMFGDPIENAERWEVKRLKDLAIKICSGSTPEGGEKVYVEQGTVFLRSQNVWRRKLELDDVVYIDQATHTQMCKTSLKSGDILITKTGRINTENSSLGRAAIFLGEDDSANINGHVYLIRLKPEVLREFVLYTITTSAYREYIRSVCVGGIDKRQINKEHLEEFPIISPPNEAQHEFLKYLTIIEKQRETLLEQLDSLETLFSSLQKRAFRGELSGVREMAQL